MFFFHDSNDYNNKFYSSFIDISPFGILKFPRFENYDKINEKTLNFYSDEIKRILNLFNNQIFLKKAPLSLIELERKKLDNYQNQKKKLLYEINLIKN